MTAGLTVWPGNGTNLIVIPFQNIMNETGNIYGISVGFCFLLKGVNDTQAVESTIRATKYYSNLCESMSITNL